MILRIIFVTVGAAWLAGSCAPPPGRAAAADAAVPACLLPGDPRAGGSCSVVERRRLPPGALIDATNALEPGALIVLTAPGTLHRIDLADPTAEGESTLPMARPAIPLALARGADGYAVAGTTLDGGAVALWHADRSLNVDLDAPDLHAMPPVSPIGTVRVTGTALGFAVWATRSGSTGCGAQCLDRTWMVAVDAGGRRFGGPVELEPLAKVGRPEGGPEAPALLYLSAARDLVFSPLTAQGTRKDKVVVAPGTTAPLGALAAGQGGWIAAWAEGGAMAGPSALLLSALRPGGMPCRVETPLVQWTAVDSPFVPLLAVAGNRLAVVRSTEQPPFLLRLFDRDFDSGDIPVPVDVESGARARLLPHAGGFLLVTEIREAAAPVAVILEVRC